MQAQIAGVLNEAEDGLPLIDLLRNQPTPYRSYRDLIKGGSFKCLFIPIL